MDGKYHLKNARRIATLLDSKFKFGSFSFGFDPLFSIVPGLGSFVGAFTSFYLIWIAAKLNVPAPVFIRMGLNIFVDFLIGEIPLVGIFFDMFYKSNIRNIVLLERFLGKPHEEGVIEGEVIA